MARKKYFDHTGPDGKIFWNWITDETGKYSFAGENLAVNFESPKETVEAWMNSRSHKENILNGKFDEIGIGIARGKYKGYDAIYIVQMFGKNRNGGLVGFLSPQ